MCSYARRTEISKKYLSAVSNPLILASKTLKPNQKPLIDKPTGTHSPKKIRTTGGYPCKIKQASVFCHFILGNKNPALKFQQGMSKCNFTLSGSLRPHQTTKIKRERENKIKQINKNKRKNEKTDDNYRKCKANVALSCISFCYTALSFTLRLLEVRQV